MVIVPRLVLMRIELVRMAPFRLALARFAWLRLAPARFAPKRSESPRSQFDRSNPCRLAPFVTRVQLGLGNMPKVVLMSWLSKTKIILDIMIIKNPKDKIFLII